MHTYTEGYKTWGGSEVVECRRINLATPRKKREGNSTAPLDLVGILQGT